MQCCANVYSENSMDVAIKVLNCSLMKHQVFQNKKQNVHKRQHKHVCVASVLEQGLPNPSGQMFWDASLQ